MPSNTSLPVAWNQTSGIWVNSQCPSVEDCAACFEYVNVANTVGTAKLVSSFKLSKSKLHPKMLIVWLNKGFCVLLDFIISLYNSKHCKGGVLHNTPDTFIMNSPPNQYSCCRLMQLFFSGKVKRMHAWILHEEKRGNIFHEHYCIP